VIQLTDFRRARVRERVKKTAAETFDISQRALSYYLKKFDFD